MGQVRMAGGGSSVDLDVTTATAGDVIAGKVILDTDANLIQGTFTLSGTAGTGDVSSGRTFYSNDPQNKQSGTITERGTNQYGSGSISGGYLVLNAPYGIYRKNGYSWAPEVRISYVSLRSLLGLTADKLKKGVTTLGITGTY